MDEAGALAIFMLFLGYLSLGLIAVSSFLSHSNLLFTLSVITIIGLTVLVMAIKNSGALASEDNIGGNKFNILDGLRKLPADKITSHKRLFGGKGGMGI